MDCNYLPPRLAPLQAIGLLSQQAIFFRGEHGISPAGMAGSGTRLTVKTRIGLNQSLGQTSIASQSPDESGTI